MFHSISWQSYWLTLALLCAGYYLAIYLLYYRSDFKIRIPRRPIGRTASACDQASQTNPLPVTPVQPSLFHQEEETGWTLPASEPAEAVVHHCMDELTAFFEEARRRKWAREELLQALRGILRKYPSLPASPYKESLSRVIVSQCEHHCSIHFSAADLVRVW